MEEDFFEKYVNKFNHDIKGVELKHKHSYRVVDKAMRIANTLDLNKKELEIVRVASLFHDIARFEQITQYNTFDDNKSFDHGDRGYEILKENNYKNNIVLNAVKYHNKYRIPSYLDKKSIPFCKIVRDSDKIDILEHQGNNCTSENCTIPVEILDFFRKNKSIGRQKNKKVEGNLISLLTMIAFIFDINYLESFKMIKELDLINKKCDVIKEKNIKGIEEIRKICNEYLESRLNYGRIG